MTLASVKTVTQEPPDRPGPAALDGADEDMFPLRTATDAARLLGCSAQHVHDLMVTGALPYVLLPPSDGRAGNPDTEGRRRRIRNDHLKQAITAWTAT